MRTNMLVKLKRKMATFTAVGAFLLIPFGSCSLGEITTTMTTTTTLDGRDVLISLVRSLIVTPIDRALTTGIEQLISNLEDDE